VKRHDPNYKNLIKLKLRIPSWCHYPDEEPQIKLYQANEENLPYKIEKGYAVTSILNESNFDFTYKIPISYRRMVANPHVTANRGRVAITHGPVVYCFEEADNPGLNDRVMLLPVLPLCQAETVACTPFVSPNTALAGGGVDLWWGRDWRLILRRWKAMPGVWRI
jgi:DUF1680 family protein